MSASRPATTATASTRARRTVAGLCLLLGVLLAFSGAAGAQGQGSVLVTEVDGAITPVTADHLADAVIEAGQGGYEALVVTLDTPGGLLDSTRDIVQTFLTANVPVVVYVSPSGASASSAGAIMTFAAHVAAMAPGTNIGAATPVNMEGGEVIDKIIEDSASYVRAIAEERGRDVDFAVDTVREGRSASVSEAVDIGAVDLQASSLDQLLQDLDGHTVALQPDPTDASAEVAVTLATAGADVVEFEMTWTRSVQQLLANPTLTFIFLSIAPLAILYEVISPSGGVGAITGVILLILAFFSSALLPVSTAGIALLVLAAALFAAELFAPGIGVFAAGGAVALLLGGLFLFEAPTGISLDLSFLIPTAVGLGVLAIVIGRFAVRAQRSRRYTGQGGETVGERGTVRMADGTSGQVMVAGVLWRARSTGPELVRGERVRVVDMEGLTLVVEPEEATDNQPV